MTDGTLKASLPGRLFTLLLVFRLIQGYDVEAQLSQNRS
jgi:hypothetical protein